LDSEDLRVKRRKLGSDLITQEQPLAIVRRERDDLLTQIQQHVFEELQEEFRLALSSAKKEQLRPQVEMAHKLTLAKWLQVLNEEEELRSSAVNSTTINCWRRRFLHW